MKSSSVEKVSGTDRWDYGQLAGFVLIGFLAAAVGALRVAGDSSGTSRLPSRGTQRSPGPTSTTAARSEPVSPAPPPAVTFARVAPVTVLFGDHVLVGDSGGRFTDVTPAHGPDEYIYDVFFVDRRLGWIGFTDVNTTAGRLVRTVDAGRTWQTTPLHANQHQSAGSRVWLDFLDHRYGWVVDSAAAGGAVIYRTVDGGQTWSDYKTLEDARGPVLFDTPRHGWMAAWAGPQPGPGLFETLDGGDSWKKRPVHAPPGVRADDLIFRLPTFTGPRGVLPAAAGDHHVAFYSTVDRGQHWRLAATTTTDAAVRAGMSVASDEVWWVIPDKGGRVMTTQDGGRNWTTTSRSGLPDYVIDLEATDAHHAWASAVNVGQQPIRLYETTDGGATWRPDNRP